MQADTYPQEQMHRIAYTGLTAAQIADKLRAAGEGPSSRSTLASAGCRRIATTSPT